MKHPFNPTLSDAEIIGSAYISDNVHKAYRGGLPKELGFLIASEKLKGNHVVLVYWPTGESAVMPCVPGTDMPSPEDIITAYRACKMQAQISTKGGFA